MKLFKILLISFCMFFIPNITKANYISIEQDALLSPNYIEGNDYFNQAYEAYCAAKNATVATEKGYFYAKAISNISKAKVIENDNVAYFVLSMQIYRGKGVLPYAKKTFYESERLLQKSLEHNVNNAALLLDYAILCRAGDIAYSSEYDEYREKAKKLAQKVCTLLDKDNSPKSLRSKAMANLVLGNEDKFLVLLRESAEGIHKDSTSKFYISLYNSFVDKGLWLWPVDNKYLNNEYLLYYLCDLSRKN